MQNKEDDSFDYIDWAVFYIENKETLESRLRAFLSPTEAYILFQVIFQIWFMGSPSLLEDKLAFDQWPALADIVEKGYLIIKPNKNWRGKITMENWPSSKIVKLIGS